MCENNLENIKIKVKNIYNNYKDNPVDGYILGDGPIPSDILFIGEAPGKTEVEQGKPFVGTAGNTFEYYLNSIGYKRQQVRITNTCYFRPVKIKKNSSGKTSISNRTPKTNEIELFREILDEEIKITNPKIIVTLGNIPLKRLTNFKSIGNCHSQLYFNKNLNKNIFPMYHPSSLNYNRNEDFLTIYKNDWQKLKKVLDTL